MSGCIHHLAISHSPVFLLNSCLDLFSAPPSPEDPFSRGYRVILPSSLTVIHPSASVYSTRPRVSVYGTGGHALKLSGFSGEHGYPRCQRAPKGLLYYRVSAGGPDLPGTPIPTPFNGLFRQAAAVSLLRLHVARMASSGMLTASAIGAGVRLALRTRLTQGRLASPWKPWSFGEGESHPLYRYLYLHLPFRTLQSGSRRAFCAVRNAPLPTPERGPTASAPGFIPDYYPRPAPRLVSCYALFE